MDWYARERRRRACRWARHALDDHAPRLFTLLGQTSMLGIGEVGPEATKGALDHLTRKADRYPRVLDDMDLRTS